jgi:hypothetical protein
MELKSALVRHCFSFNASSCNELVNALGFSKDELHVKVEEAINMMSANQR